MKKKNIVLIGFMGTGKTTNGRRLARKLRKKFVDTDNMIESEMGMSVDSIFKEYGEKYFRELERDIVKEVSKMENVVISTGGGVVLNSENVKNLKRTGVIFLLRSTAEEIANNLKNSYKKRPLLDREDWEKHMEEMLKKRRDRYVKSADYIIDVNDKNHFQIVGEISLIYNQDRKRKKYFRK